MTSRHSLTLLFTSTGTMALIGNVPLVQAISSTFLIHLCGGVPDGQFCLLCSTQECPGSSVPWVAFGIPDPFFLHVSTCLLWQGSAVVHSTEC